MKTKAKPVIILFNGPPYSGKDLAGDLMQEIISEDINENWSKFSPLFSVSRMKFAQPIKDAVMAFVGATNTKLKTEYCESERKDFPLAPLNMTPRQAFISFSEEWAKVKFGDTIFGKLAASKILSTAFFESQIYTSAAHYYIFTDCGFQQEVNVLINEFGADRCYVLQLHRPGKSFKNDSRQYVYSPNKRQEILLYNNDSVASLKAIIRNAMTDAGIMPTQLYDTLFSETYAALDVCRPDEY